jgi:transcriptional regulator with XRE-family HTH domain
MSVPASRLATSRPVGELLRDWRQRRRMSQLDLACEADISTRHLSFVETGRAQPSREMLLHLAERLNVPLRERNALLIAAGFAPMFAERSLDDPALKAARQALDLVLQGHEPYPALAVDRHWNLVAMNRAVGAFMDGIAPELLQPPVNVLRLALHPGGLAPRIVNLVEWRAHLIARLHQQIAASADPGLDALMRELCDYPVPGDSAPALHTDYGGVVVPFQLKTEAGVLSFFTTITVFGTPVDITLSELALEAFFPADAATAAALRRLGDLQAATASA